MKAGDFHLLPGTMAKQSEAAYTSFTQGIVETDL